MQAEYERNPGSVSDEWRHFFESLNEERGSRATATAARRGACPRRSCWKTAISSRR